MKQKLLILKDRAVPFLPNTITVISKDAYWEYQYLKLFDLTTTPPKKFSWAPFLCFVVLDSKGETSKRTKSWIQVSNNQINIINQMFFFFSKWYSMLLVVWVGVGKGRWIVRIDSCNSFCLQALARPCCY